MEVSNVFRPVFIPTPRPTASIRYPKRKRNSSPSISGYYTTEPLRQLIYLQKKSITNLLKLPFLELYADYYSTVKEHKVTTLHKEEIGYFFLDLLLKHYKENKEVAFYAEKLHVSSKYLTEALTLVSGKSPKEWIIHYTLQEIYALLENPSISIQEIVQRTRFANPATLRRFFKRHTGTSLLQYRKQDLYKNNQ